MATQQRFNIPNIPGIGDVINGGFGTEIIDRVTDAVKKLIRNEIDNLMEEAEEKVTPVFITMLALLGFIALMTIIILIVLLGKK